MAAPAAASATRVSRVCCARSAKAIDSPPSPQGPPSFSRSFIRSFSRLLYHCWGLQNARAMLHLLRVFAPHLRRVRHSQPLLRETRQILLQKRLHSSFHARLRGTCRPFPPLLFFCSWHIRIQFIAQVCCVSVTSKYTCNDWGQVMCSMHEPESSQCFDCGRYITLVSNHPKRQHLLQFLSSSAREALFSDVAQSGSPGPPVASTAAAAAAAAATSHVTCIVDMGRIVDGRTQVKATQFVPSATSQRMSISRLTPMRSACPAAPTRPRASATCVACGPE